MSEKRIYTLKQARQLAGLSLAEAGEKIGCGKHMVWTYENGKSSPTVHRAKEIAEAYGLSIYDIDWPRCSK